MTNQASGVPPLPEELLSRLTPDQRAQMEAAMKARAAKGPQTTVTKSCLTKDQLNKAMTFGAEGNAACKPTLTNSTSSKQDIRFDCNDEKSGMKGSGTVHIEAINSETVKGTAQVNVGGGGNMTMQMLFSAKWVSADCGDLGKK